MVLTACTVLILDNASATHAAEWGVLAYLSGEGGLEADAERYWETLLQAASAGACDVALQVDGGGAAARWAATTAGVTAWAPLGPTDMASEEALCGFLGWAAEHLNSPMLIVIVLGHGSGLATLSPEHSGIATDGGSRRGLGVGQLGRALERSGLAPVEVVSLEACYGSALEVAWALRGATRHMVASPAAVYSPGLPWASVIQRMRELPDGQALGSSLCSAHTGPLVCLNLERMGAVQAALERFADSMLGDMTAHSAGLRLARSRTRSWGYKDELCDAGQLAGLLSTHAAGVEAAEAAGGLRAALEGVACSRSRHVGGSEVIGIGLFFPPTWEPVPGSYEATYELARSTRWSRLLEMHYRASGRDLIR